MKILVTYYTESGNTEKVANAIYEEAGKTHAADMSDIRKFKSDNLEYDLIFIGSPCHSSDIAKPVRETMERLPGKPGYKIAGFITHAAPTAEEDGSSPEIFGRWAGKARGSFETLCLAKQIDLVGFFNCQGVATPEIKDFIKNHVYQDSEGFETYLERAETHPDQEDLENAMQFARSIISQL
jgi:flavodoxin